MQRDTLHAPVENLAHVEFVFALAIDGVDGPELLGSLAGGAKFSQHGALELVLVGLTVFKIARIIGVGSVKILVRTRRDAHRHRSSYAGVLGLEVPVVIEHLY